MTKVCIWNTPFVFAFFLKHCFQFPECTAVSSQPHLASSAVFPLLHYPPLATPVLSLPPWHALCSCTAAFPSILLSVCLIAGDRYVVYLTQNRTPLLFQRVEPGSQDGGPGLNNALPPPDAVDDVNSLWDTLFPLLPNDGFFCFLTDGDGLETQRVNKWQRVSFTWLVMSMQASGGRHPGEPILGDGTSAGVLPEGGLESGWAAGGWQHHQLPGRKKRPLAFVRAWTHTLGNLQKKNMQGSTTRKHIKRKKRKSGEKKTLWAPECLHTLLHSASVLTFMQSLPYETTTMLTSKKKKKAIFL